VVDSEKKAKDDTVQKKKLDEKLKYFDDKKK
jgi:hypothetical protein